MDRSFHRHSLFALGCVAALLLFPAQTRTQSLDPETAGRYYIIAYPDTIKNTFDSRFPNRMEEAVTLVFYSAVSNNVRITSPNGYNAAVQVPAGGIRTVNLNDKSNPASPTFQPAFANPSMATFMLEADEPIILYCHFATRFGGEAYTPIPVARWGTEYFVAAAPGQLVADMSPGGESDYRVSNKAASPVACVIAAYDSTQISITPPTGVFLVGDAPLGITLNKGECYTIRGFVDTTTQNAGRPQMDISGTRIVSSKPIGVVSGSPRTACGYDREVGGLAKNSIRNAAYEWLAPTDQHGTYFVHLPLMDTSRITGASGEITSDKRQYERILLTATTPGTTTVSAVENGTEIPIAPLAYGATDTSRWGRPRPHVYTSDKPAQAFQLPAPVLTYIGIAGSPGFEFGSRWYSAGGFMQELTPREQWTSFAPMFAPRIPLNAQHFVAFATDTASRHSIFTKAGEEVDFNQGTIPGTDLVWGVFPLDTGVVYWLEGRNGARFTAVQYGLWRGGYEMWRPGSARKEGGSSELLHPSEYEEVTAVAYGLPLAPRRRSLLEPDSMSLVLTNLLGTSEDRNVVRAHVSFVGPNPSGLSSLFLDAGTTTNATIVVTNPPGGIHGGETDATADIAQVDATVPASGMVVARDRSGTGTSASFRINPLLIRLGHGDTVDVGALSPGTVRDYRISFFNPNSVPTIILGGKVGGWTRDGDSSHASWGKPGSGNSGFDFVGPSNFPIAVAPNDSVTFFIRFSPTSENSRYVDSLEVLVAGTRIRTIVVGSSLVPCIHMDDLDFGTFRWPGDSGAVRTLMLSICNDGAAPLHFTSADSAWVFRFDDRENMFTVLPSWRDSLVGRVIEAGGCYRIPVTVHVLRPGTFTTIAFAQTDADCHRDSSIWSVTVQAPVNVHEWAAAGYVLETPRPTPTTGAVTIPFSIGRPGHVVVDVIDATGRLLSTLLDAELTEGRHQATTSLANAADGTYYARVRCGAWVSFVAVVVAR